MALVLFDLGFVPYARGTGSELSLARFHDALGLYEEIADVDGIAKTRGYIGFMLLLKGENAEALPLLEEFLAHSRGRGQFLQLIEQTVVVSAAHAMLGDLTAARRTALEALEVAEDGLVALGIAGVLYTMAAIDSRAGRHERAMRLMGAGEVIGESVGGGPPFFVIDLLGSPTEPARATIGERATDQALDEGRAMSVEEALAYVRQLEA